MATLFTVLLLIFTYVITATTSNDNIALCGRAPKNAREELGLAEAFLKGLSLPENYMDVRKKIDHLSMMEPKDWKNENLKEALKSFLDALNKRLDSPAQEIQNEDYNKGSQFFDHFCCAFIHKEGCDMARIELRIREYPKGAESPKEKLRGLAILTEAQIASLESRV